MNRFFNEVVPSKTLSKFYFIEPNLTDLLKPDDDLAHSASLYTQADMNKANKEEKLQKTVKNWKKSLASPSNFQGEDTVKFIPKTSR